MMYYKKTVLLVRYFTYFKSAATAWAAPGNFSVKADELEYNLQTGEGTAKGHVVLTQDGGKATADFARFNSKTKSGTLTGNVVG